MNGKPMLPPGRLAEIREVHTELGLLPDHGSVRVHGALGDALAEIDRQRGELEKYRAEPTVAEEMAHLNRCLDAVLDLCDRVEVAPTSATPPREVPDWVARVQGAATLGDSGGEPETARLRRRVAELERERAGIERAVRARVARDLAALGREQHTLSWGEAHAIAMDGLCRCRGGSKPCPAAEEGEA